MPACMIEAAQRFTGYTLPVPESQQRADEMVRLREAFRIGNDAVCIVFQHSRFKHFSPTWQMLACGDPDEQEYPG